MSKIRSKYLCALVLLTVGSLSVFASPVVKAKLDSAVIQMGAITNLKVTVDQEKSVRGQFPIFRSVAEKGYVGVCGDSVELRAPVKIDTTEVGERLQITFDIPVQSFDSGYYKLPELQFVAGVDTFVSNTPFLKVLPVPNVTAETPIAEYANIAEPENKSIFDSVPDWLYNYWWLFLIIIALAVAAFMVWKRYRKVGHILPKKPEPTPYEAAITALQALKEKKLWENGMEKEYFTELTDILRTYLFRRFRINAMEMTSRQILAAIGADKDTKEKKGMVRQILDMADFVKFAKVRPLPADNIRSFENALQFVEDTKPAPSSQEEGNKPEGGEKTENKKGGEK